MSGESIRRFFRELFGSRLVERLEEDLIRLRQDFEERMREQAFTIANLREEKAVLQQKVTLYEVSVFPKTFRQQTTEVAAYSRPIKPEFSKTSFDMPPMMTAWQKTQAEHEAQIAKELEEEAKAFKG